jgi:hypothetical protein
VYFGDLALEMHQINTLLFGRVEWAFVLWYYLSLNRSARKRLYVGKWTYLVYQLQMDQFWSILGPMTNLIDGKCSKFNGEIDNVFSLDSKT